MLETPPQKIPEDVMVTARKAFAGTAPAEWMVERAARAIMMDRVARLGGLTPKQLAAHDFIASYIRQNSCSPRYEDIQSHLGIKSKSGVYKIIQALKKRGIIKSVPGCARSIRIAG